MRHRQREFGEGAANFKTRMPSDFRVDLESAPATGNAPRSAVVYFKGVVALPLALPVWHASPSSRPWCLWRRGVPVFSPARGGAIDVSRVRGLGVSAEGSGVEVGVYVA